MIDLLLEKGTGKSVQARHRAEKCLLNAGLSWMTRESADPWVFELQKAVLPIMVPQYRR